MPFLWRISNYALLSGEGGLHYSARWHTAGHRIVYLAESPAGALIEVLAHLEIDEADWPRSYQLLQAEHPARMRMTTLDPLRTKNWQADLAVTRKLGDDWLRSGSSALARVPSAIVPETWNVLLNPQHAEAALLSATQALEYPARGFHSLEKCRCAAASLGNRPQPCAGHRIPSP